MNASNSKEYPMHDQGNFPKHIDLTYLKDFARGDNAFIIEMITVFMIQTPELLQTIKTSLETKNWPSMRGAAHKMKPSMTFMGIKEMENVVRLIEDYSSKETSLELLPELIDKLEKVCVESIKELEIEKKLFL